MMSRPPVPVTLYVGNLDDAVHEEQLFSHFSKYGPLHSIKIVKDRNTGKSRGFGYVNFLNMKDAETARMIAQYELIGRKPIRILHKGDPKQKTEANLFVKNIDPNVTFKELHNHFSTAGTVMSVKIAYNSDGKNLGYGYVQFDKPEDATKAIQSLNGTKLKEQEIAVEKFMPKQGRKMSSNNNLYVKHLPEGKSKEEIEKILNEYFSKYGKIISLLAVSRDGKVWSAFVCFESPDAAAQALNELNGVVTVEDATQPLYVNFHVSRQERALERKKDGQIRNETNIFIKNLKPEVTEQDIHNLFNVYGEITNCGIKEVDFRGQKYKMAFVNYKYPEEATKAQSESSHKEEIKKLFYDSPYIGLWLSKDQRIQYKQTQMNRKPVNTHIINNPSQYPGGYQQPFSGYMQPNQPLGMVQPPHFPAQGFSRPGQFAFNQHLNPPIQPQQNQLQMQNPQAQQQPFQPRVQNQFSRSRQGGYAGGPKGPSQQRGPGPRIGGPGGHNQGMYSRGPNTNPHRRPQNQQNQQMGENSVGNTRRNEPEQNTKPPESHQALTVQNLKDKLDDFLKLDSDKQRNILGELLYPKILGVAGPTFAPKITGMLVDFEVLTIQDILELLEDQNTLNERIAEAQELIQQENEQ